MLIADRILAVVAVTGLTVSACWLGSMPEPAPVAHRDLKPTNVPRRYPTRIRALDCQAAMERLASATQDASIAECDGADDYWYCAFVTRQFAWYELNAYAYRVVDECAPEAWKATP